MWERGSRLIFLGEPCPDPFSTLLASSVQSVEHMEQDKSLKEKERQEAIRKLEEELHRDLKRGHFYGLDLKIRSIQRTVHLGTRV